MTLPRVLMVHLVAQPDVMRDRPGRDRRHGDDVAWNVVRLVVTAYGEVPGEAGRQGALVEPVAS